MIFPTGLGDILAPYYNDVYSKEREVIAKKIKKNLLKKDLGDFGKYKSIKELFEDYELEVFYQFELKEKRK